MTEHTYWNVELQGFPVTRWQASAWRCYHTHSHSGRNCATGKRLKAVQVDMCIGSVIKAVWNRWKPKESEAFVPVAASGLIAGDGLWTVPAALLAIGHLNPPICMSFSGAS